MSRVKAIEARAGSLTDNAAVADALANYLLWLAWYPGDWQGAAEFAGDHIDTEAELDELIETVAKIAA